MNQTTYPSVINRACAMLLEGDSFTNMPDGYIRIVMRIIKKINIAKPHAPIFASRARLASESGKSICSVHRAVKWLEDFGFIQRQQTARPELRGSSSPLVPTEKMLTALQLLGHHQPSTTKQPEVSPQTQGSELDCIADSSKSMNLKNDNHSENIRKPEAFVRLQKVKIPHELAWLVEQQQLRATGVLSLMKLAKHAKNNPSPLALPTTTTSTATPVTPAPSTPALALASSVATSNTAPPAVPPLAPAVKEIAEPALGKLYARVLSERLSQQTDYPSTAAMRGWQGLVQIRITLSRQGDLLQAQIANSSGFTVLDQHALQRVKEATPLPTIAGAGLGDPLHMLIPVHYRLERS